MEPEKLVQIDDFAAYNRLIGGSLDLRKLRLALAATSSSGDAAPIIVPPPRRYTAVPTPYVVSTMTIIAGIDTKVDLELVYGHIACRTVEDKLNKVLNVRYANFPPRGVYTPKVKRMLAGAVPKHTMFTNQVTMDLETYPGRKISVKLFRDGRVQLAGCKTFEEGTVALRHLLPRVAELQGISCDGVMQLRLGEEELQALRLDQQRMSACEWRDRLQAVRAKRLKSIAACSLPVYSFPYVRRAVERDGPLSPLPAEIVMINSDFDARAPIDKERFTRVMKDKYNLYCAPQSSKYPGINVKYVTKANCVLGCREADDPVHSLQCAMDSRRHKQRQGCALVSILAFSLGKVILTGARSLAQLDEAYAFITRVFRDDYPEICPLDNFADPDPHICTAAKAAAISWRARSMTSNANLHALPRSI